MDRWDSVWDKLGSRNGHCAIEVDLNRRLISDIYRQKRQPLAIASVDVANCYDTIVHPFAIMG